MSYRNTEHDIRYYATDLNKWIAHNCTREMTCSNIDGNIYKASTNKLMILEAKHLDERLWSQEYKILTINHQSHKFNPNINYVGAYIIYVDISDNGEFNRARIYELATDQWFDIYTPSFFKRFIELDWDEIRDLTTDDHSKRYKKELVFNKH